MDTPHERMVNHEQMIKQEQMNQNLAMLQQVEDEVRQQVLSAPAPKLAHPPPARSPLQTSPR